FDQAGGLGVSRRERRGSSPEHPVDQRQVALPLRVAPRAGTREEPDERLAEAHVPDRLAEALLPSVRLTRAEHDLCFRIGLDQLTEEMPSGPVRGGVKAREDLLPG